MPIANKRIYFENLARQGDRWNASLLLFLTAMFADAASYLPNVLGEHNSIYRRKKKALYVRWASMDREERRQTRVDLASDLLVVEARFNRKLLGMVDLFRSYLAACREAGVAIQQYPTDWIYRDIPRSRRLIMAEFLPASALCDLLFNKYNLSKGKKSARIIRAAEREQYHRRSGRQSARDQTASVTPLQRQQFYSQEFPGPLVIDEQQELEPVSYWPLSHHQPESGSVRPQIKSYQSARDQTASVTPLQRQQFYSQEFPGPLVIDEQKELEPVSYWPLSYHQPESGSVRPQTKSYQSARDQTASVTPLQRQLFYSQEFPGPLVIDEQKELEPVSYWPLSYHQPESGYIRPQTKTYQSRDQSATVTALQRQLFYSQEFPGPLVIDEQKELEPVSYWPPYYQPESRSVRPQTKSYQPFPDKTSKVNTLQGQPAARPGSPTVPAPEADQTESRPVSYWPPPFCTVRPETESYQSDKVKTFWEDLLLGQPSARPGSPTAQVHDADQTALGSVYPWSVTYQPGYSVACGAGCCRDEGEAASPWKGEGAHKRKRKAREVDELDNMATTKRVRTNGGAVEKTTLVNSVGRESEVDSEGSHDDRYYWGQEENPRSEEWFGIMEAEEPANPLFVNGPTVLYYNPAKPSWVWTL